MLACLLIGWVTGWLLGGSLVAACVRMTAAMGHFSEPNLLFWLPQGSFLGPWDTILVILVPTGTPNGHTEAQTSVFIYIFIGFGESPGTNFRHIFSICCDLG